MTLFSCDSTISIQEIRANGYDVIGVNVFPHKLTGFNWIIQCALYYLQEYDDEKLTFSIR